MWDLKFTSQAGPQLGDCPQQLEAVSVTFTNSKSWGRGGNLFPELPHYGTQKSSFHQKISQGRGAASKWWDRRFLLPSPKENQFGWPPTDETAFVGGPESRSGCQHKAGRKQSDTGCIQEGERNSLSFPRCPSPKGTIQDETRLSWSEEPAW